MSQNFLRSPKARVLAAYPKAVCKKDWTRSGSYTVQLGTEAKDFNGKPITAVHTGTANPADAWFEACCELRII